MTTSHPDYIDRVLEGTYCARNTLLSAKSERPAAVKMLNGSLVPGSTESTPTDEGKALLGVNLHIVEIAGKVNVG